MLTVRLVWLLKVCFESFLCCRPSGAPASQPASRPRQRQKRGRRRAAPAVHLYTILQRPSPPEAAHEATAASSAVPQQTMSAPLEAVLYDEVLQGPINVPVLAAAHIAYNVPGVAPAAAESAATTSANASQEAARPPRRSSKPNRLCENLLSSSGLLPAHNGNKMAVRRCDAAERQRRHTAVQAARRAAVVIQAAWRHHMQRMRLRTAAVHIQAAWRGRQQRASFLKQRSCIITVQSLVRRRLARGMLLQLKSAWEARQAAIHVQQRATAAAKLQAGWRGFLARRALRHALLARQAQAAWASRQARMHLRTQVCNSIAVQQIFLSCPTESYACLI